MNKKGFTLIELLVVIAVIATITAIAVVGLSRARDQSIASKIYSDFRTIEKSLTSLMLEDQESVWWRDTSFGAGNDPSVDNVTGLSQYLKKAPTPGIPGVGSYDYDNDGDVLTAASSDMNGVNIVVDFSSSTTAMRDKMFNIIDNSSDYKTGTADGKVRTNGTDYIFYNVAVDEANW